MLNHSVKILRLRNICARRFRRLLSSEAPDNGKHNSVPATFKMADLSLDNVPVEKKSLMRGLAANKFEKDFLIFPEYTDTDDVRNIQGFTNSLRDSLMANVDSRSMEEHGKLTDSALLALERNAVSSIFVPSEFSGLGMSNKDQMKVFEELSLDWSLYSSVNAANLVSRMIVLFGSEEQKQKYLPLIASGKYKPGYAVWPQNGSDVALEVIGNASSKDSGLLNGNVKIVNGHSANLILMFAPTTHPITKEQQMCCYLIDKATLSDDSQYNINRVDTLGLKALDVCDVNVRIQLNGESMLGESGQGVDIQSELCSAGHIPLSAATVGFCRRLLADLANYCNQTPSTSMGGSLAEESFVQRTVSKLATKTYALESLAYYLGGLLDENLPIVVDIENAILHILTRDVLRLCTSTVVQLCSVRAIDKDAMYELYIRDINTLLSMTGGDVGVEKIAMATLSSCAANQNRPTSSLARWFRNEKTLSDLKEPKLTHYIAEHAHPSLQLACQELEFSMSRLNTVISKMITEQGKNIEQDYGSLESLVTVLKNNLSMVAVIARSSRSYSIGVRNADIELAWAISLCSRLSRESWFELEALSDYFGLVRLNPSLLNAGRAVLDLGGYCIESPIERNW